MKIIVSFGILSKVIACKSEIRAMMTRLVEEKSKILEKQLELKEVSFNLRLVETSPIRFIFN